jgi:NAD(P)-dependent dehydrogenase (short-subunit alcohol dehydrogenase family)
MVDQSMFAGFRVDLAGKVAVVLGASAEGGTGWAIAEALAAQGAKVVVGARSLAPLQRLAERIGGTAVACDAGNEAQVAALAKAALDTYGHLNIAVNSAGLPVMTLIADTTQANLDDAVRVNFFGNVYFVKYMAQAIGSNGSIVLISSMSTTHPVFPHYAYACGKSASDCLVRYAAVEYGPRGIRVNSILPGAIKSEMAREAFAIPGFEDAYLRNIPLGRVGYPADFANTVLWLAGPSYVTGLNLQVSGGNQLTRFPYPSELPMGEETYGSGKPLADRQGDAPK